MKKDKERSLESGYYGDTTHLTYFLVSTQSYRLLLEAIRETLIGRGTLMPFIPEDVFGRHEYLGGMHAERGLTSMERRQLYSSLLSAFMSNDDEDEREDDVAYEGSNPMREHVDLFELFTQNNEDVDPLDHMLLKKLKIFFLHAVSKNDLFLIRQDPEEEIRVPMFTLRSGGLSEQPPVGELIFFEQHKKAGSQQNPVN